MPLIDTVSSEITFKVVYYGPPMSGKSTNLYWIHRATPEADRGPFTSLTTGTDRTLFFDILPAELGMIRGLKPRLALYAVPGQRLSRFSRKSVLRAADGIVFVADSAVARRQDNIACLADMQRHLQDAGLAHVPVIFQLNKRDTPDVMKVHDMTADLGLEEATVFLGVANAGVAVMDCLKSVGRKVAGGV